MKRLTGEQRKVAAWAKRRWEKNWSYYNAFGKLRIWLEYKLAGDRSLSRYDPVYVAVEEYSSNFNQAEAEKILKDERQIARHAMIIRLTNSW